MTNLKLRMSLRRALSVWLHSRYLQRSAGLHCKLPTMYYDLMIIDVRMPRINGFNLYRQLKKRDTGVKVCFLTAFQIYYEEFRKMFPTIDVKAFIRKPVSISNLVNQINAAIASK